MHNYKYKFKNLETRCCKVAQKSVFLLLATKPILDKRHTKYLMAALDFFLN